MRLSREKSLTITREINRGSVKQVKQVNGSIRHEAAVKAPQNRSRTYKMKGSKNIRKNTKNP